MTLPRLYPLVDTATLEARDIPLEGFVRSLLEGGAEMLQLRNKHGAPAEVLRQADQISMLLEGTYCRAVMNDRADLAVLAGWTAVHTGHRDLPPEAVRTLLGQGGMIGVSTHNPEQVMQAETGTADYVAIGPVFATGSKSDTEPVVGLAGVREARSRTRKPLVAIGGITRENAASVIEAGADTVAVIGALLDPDRSVSAVVGDFLLRLR